MILSPLPFFEPDDWRGGLFYLLYQQYGGSALQLSYADLMEMEIVEIFWFLDRLKEMRTHESEEITKARG